MFRKILFILFFLLQIQDIHPGGSSSSDDEIIFLRDQFSTANSVVSGLNVVDSTHTNLTLGSCNASDGYNVCSGSANANCCIGNSSYNASAFTIFSGMRGGLYQIMTCFAIPDFTTGVNYKCYNLKQGDNISINVQPGLSLNLSAKLEYFDETNPGYEANFDTNKANSVPTSPGMLGVCNSCNNNIILNCGGYAFTENAYNSLYKIDNSIPPNPNTSINCDDLIQKYQIGCENGSLCECDGSCQQNNFLPKNLGKLQPRIQECYLCNQGARQVEFHCKNNLACIGSFLFKNLKNNIDFIFDNYGKGTYICAYNGDQRLGCSKVRILSGIRHCPSVARIDDMLDANDRLFLGNQNTSSINNLLENKLVSNPQYNLFQEFPHLRDFFNSQRKHNNICDNNNTQEKGFKFRGTFFNPLGQVVFGATDVTVSFLSEFFVKQYTSGDTSLVSQAYNLFKILAINNSLFGTKFGDTIYRIQKTYQDPTKNCAIMTNSNLFIDVIVRMEYNLNTNENDFVAYAMIPVSNYGQDIIDPLTKNIKVYYTTLAKDNFISSNIYYKDSNGNYMKDCNGDWLKFSAYYSNANSCSGGETSYYKYKDSTCACTESPSDTTIYALVNIGSVPRPTLRHHYNSSNILVHPLSIASNQASSSGANFYVDSYIINLLPANSVNPLSPKNDPDYFIPPQSGTIQVVADLRYYDPNNNAEKLSTDSMGVPNFCTFLFGHLFCANLDPCVFFLNFGLNSSSAANSYLSNAIENLLTLYCSNRIFCPSTSTINSCMEDPVNGGLPLPGTQSDKVMGFYNFNKDFRNFITLANGETSANLLICLSLESPNWLSETGNIYLYGPYGNASLDNVLTFIRDNNSNIATTRPLTFINPDADQTYTASGSLYRINEALMLNNLPTNTTNIYNSIFGEIANNPTFNWLDSFAGCGGSTLNCFAKKLKIRPIETEEWSMKTLCAPLTSYPTQSNVFAFSRHTKENDYNMYIPLKCQFLKIEGYSAGGGGMTAQDSDRCTSDGYLSQPVAGPITASRNTEPLIPRISSTGCNGSYIKATVDINNAFVSKMYENHPLDYLAFQVGEETHQCKINDMLLSFSSGCIPSGSAFSEDGINKLIGGCHDHYPYIKGNPSEIDSNGEYTWKYFWDNSYFNGGMTQNNVNEDIKNSYNFQNVTTIDSNRNTGSDSSGKVHYSGADFATFHGDTVVSLFDPDDISHNTLFALSKGRSNLDYIFNYFTFFYDGSTRGATDMLSMLNKTSLYGYITYGWTAKNGGCIATMVISCALSIAAVLTGCAGWFWNPPAMVACYITAAAEIIPAIIYGFTVLTYEACYSYDVTDIYRNKQCGGTIQYDPNFIPTDKMSYIPGNDDSMKFSFGRRKILSFASDSAVDLRVFANNGSAIGYDTSSQVGLGSSSQDGSIISIADKNKLCSSTLDIVGFKGPTAGTNYNIDNCFFGGSGAFNDGVKATSPSCNVQPNNSSSVISEDFYTNYPPSDVSFTLTSRKTSSGYIPDIGTKNMPYCYNNENNRTCLTLDIYGSTLCNNACSNNNINIIPNLSVEIVNQDISSNNSGETSNTGSGGAPDYTTSISIPYCGSDVVDLTTDTTISFFGSKILNSSCNDVCVPCNNNNYCATSAGIGSIGNGKFTCTYQLSLNDISQAEDFGKNFSPYLQNNVPYNQNACSSNCVIMDDNGIDNVDNYTNNTNNSKIPDGCQNDSNLTDYDKYSGAGGSGKITVSIPIIAYQTTSNGKSMPYFKFDTIKGYTKTMDPLLGQDMRVDSDCSFKCPKINVYYRNIPITLPNFSTHSSDLICEYSGSPENDMEVKPNRVIFPKKCFIVSNESTDDYLRLFHGAIITLSNCPIVNCINGIYNLDNSRLYGICLYPENVSNPNGKDVYQRSIRASANIFSGDSTDSTVIYSDLYELLYEGKTNSSIEIAHCTFNNLSNNFLLNNPIFSQNILSSKSMALSCDSDGFWIDLSRKNIIYPDIHSDGAMTRNNPDISASYLYKYLRDDGELEVNLSTLASYQVKKNQAFITKYNYIEASSLFKEYLVSYGNGKGRGRRVFADYYDNGGNIIDFTNIYQMNTIKNNYFINILNSLYSPSSGKMNVFKSKSKVYCPPLISNRIPFDSGYTGNAIWNQAVEGNFSVTGVCCDASDTQIPTRRCLHNGRWGKVNNPCKTLCKIKTEPPL